MKVGSRTQLWNKLIKEVRAGHVAGPYDNIPFENYIQSPIGLVPKAGNSGQTRLIFHLSFDFGEKQEDLSLNHHTDDELCTVKYNDINAAVKQCIEVQEEARALKAATVEFDEMTADNKSNQMNSEDNELIFLGKSDIKSAFCLVPLSLYSWMWLIMMAMNPKTKKWQFFVDKCLPFGASISCAVFQRFSNALKHLMQFRTNRKSLTNYLDDFLFIAYMKQLCDNMIQPFIDLCQEVGVLLAFDKTEWSSVRIVFLGILLDGKDMILAIPEDKRRKAINLL